MSTTKTKPIQELTEEEIYKVDIKNETTTKNLPKNNKKDVVFKSLHRNTIIFKTPTKYIKFTGHLYRTDDEEIIEYLRNHKAFGTEIFEGEFPPDIQEKFRKDKEFIRTFNIEDEDYLGLY